MRILNRPYDEERIDFKRMWGFLIQDYTDRQERYIWSIGRLGDWKYGLWTEKRCFPNLRRKNAQLWFNDLDELVGFAISEGYDSRFAILAKRGFEFLYPELIQWVKNNWGDRGELGTEVCGLHTEYIDVLNSLGFINKGLMGLSRQYDLKEKANEEIKLDSEFTIQDMQTKPDLMGRLILGNNAWSGRSDVTELDYLKYEYNRENPGFYPQFDLSVVDKDGKHLSSCMAFVDWKNNMGEVEKVCTHSEYRRMGLAEACIRECFKRLYHAGIHTAYITGYSNEAKGLYGKLGAAKEIEIYDFVLPSK